MKPAFEDRLAFNFWSARNIARIAVCVVVNAAFGAIPVPLPPPFEIPGATFGLVGNMYFLFLFGPIYGMLAEFLQANLVYVILQGAVFYGAILFAGLVTLPGAVYGLLWGGNLFFWMLKKGYSRALAYVAVVIVAGPLYNWGGNLIVYYMIYATYDVAISASILNAPGTIAFHCFMAVVAIALFVATSRVYQTRVKPEHDLPVGWHYYKTKKRPVLPFVVAWIALYVVALAIFLVSGQYTPLGSLERNLIMWVPIGIGSVCSVIGGWNFWNNNFGCYPKL
jgi:hypothetical protein